MLIERSFSFEAAAEQLLLSADFDGNFALGRESDIEWGWTIGGGLEYAFSDELSARIEYRYTDLGSTQVTNDVFDFDNNFHAVRVGLSWHFDSMQ